MPDAETQSLYDELNRRGVFSSSADAQAIGHELRRRGVVSDATQGGLVKPAPSQASSSKPFSPTSGNTLPPPSQADLQKQFASSKASNAPITMQKLPSSGKVASTALGSGQRSQTFEDFMNQAHDYMAGKGNLVYNEQDLQNLPHTFVGNLQRNVSGFTTPQNLGMMAAMAALPGIGPLGVAASRAAGLYFGAQGVAGGIKEGIEQTKQGGLAHGVGAGLGAALPFIAPAALGKAGEIINKRGLPAPPEAQPAAPVQPARPIAPTEPGTARPPFVGTPTPETATPAPAPTIAPKKGDVLSSDYVFHNTSPEAIAAIEKSGMDSGSFSDKPIKFGQKSYIAIKRSDLPGPVQSHSYGDAISHEPQWETGIDAEGNSIRAAVPANKIMLVDGKGKVIRALGEPPASLQKTPKNIQNNIPVSSEATAAAPVNMATPAVEPPVTPETPAVPNPAPTAETLPPESQSAFDRIKANQAAKQTPAPVETSPPAPIVESPTVAKTPTQIRAGNRQAQKQVQGVDQMLIDVANHKAQTTGNDYIQTLLNGVKSQTKSKFLTQGDRNLLNNYIFGSPEGASFTDLQTLHEAIKNPPAETATKPAEVAPTPVKPAGLPKPAKSNPTETVKQVAEKSNNNGFTKDQQSFLVKALDDAATNLPERSPAEIQYPHGKKTEGQPITIDVPGDGKFTVSYKDQANTLRAEIAKNPGKGFVRYPVQNNVNFDFIVKHFGGLDQAVIGLEKQIKAVDPEGTSKSSDEARSMLSALKSAQYAESPTGRYHTEVHNNFNGSDPSRVQYAREYSYYLDGHGEEPTPSSKIGPKVGADIRARIENTHKSYFPEKYQPSKIDTVEQSAQDRIAARKTEGKSSLGSTGGKAASDAIENIQDLAIIGAARIARGAVNFADWSKDFVSHVATHLGDAYADSIKPHLQAIYDAARSKHEENQENVQTTGLRPVSQDEPRSETNIVAPERASTAAGKPVEGTSAQRATSGQPSEPKINAEVPSGETKSTGIAQRVHDTRKPGEILPGQGASPEEMINRGRTLIKDGADPEAHLQMMEKRGSAVSGDDMSILRAEHERLSKITDAASDASRARPLDAKLKAADKSAYQDETDWAKRIKPYQTEWSNIGKAQQGETDVNTGSFSGIRRVFEDKDHANRPMTTNEVTQAQNHADKVKGLETKVSDLQSKLDTAMKQTAETKTTVRTQTNATGKVKLPTDAAELRKAFADMRANGTLYAGGKIKSPTPGAKTGAVNFGKPQFTPEVARAIWNHAKENYIDKGVDFPTTVNGVASDLGLTHDEVMGAFAQNKYIKDISDEMYKTMSARRDAVNAAKRFIETSNQSGAAKAWNTVTNLPRGIAVFGHGSVGMVTHAGANIFRPTSWFAYWPNALNQFKYWTDGAFHERAMQKIENDPNYTMWDRNGLRINPDKAYDDYQKYGKFIGNIGRAGNRGMDALKSFRMEYANKIWEGLPENLKQQKDMPKLIADWVNHATGVGSIGHGQIASAVHEGTFAATLEASRWARLIGDPVKTAKTFANWKTATPAEQAIAKFRVQRAAELTAVMAGALAANNGLLVATNQKDRINMLHPTQSDWLKFKWDGKTFDPTGNLAAPVKFLAQLLAEANPNRTPAAWEHGEKRSELMTQTAGQYIRGKLAPQYGIGADVATGADAIGRPLPWAKEPGKPSAPKYTPTEYTLKHAPLPFAGAAEAVYEAMREKGANDAEARGWVDKMTKYGGTFAKTLGTEMTGIRVGKPSKPFIPASKGSGVSYKSPKF